MRSLLVLLSTIFVSTNSITLTIPELGQVRGFTGPSAWTNRTIYHFLSVKYGESPSGNRRFAPPEPVVPWNNVYDATVQGVRCPQIYKLDEIIDWTGETDMEDCLSMNIFSPMLPDNNTLNNELLPVMVYLHGGGFYEGESKFFYPNYMLENDVLLVVPQYRLGSLGFLSIHTDGIPGNAAFMDQLLALQWINKYIKNFGGDNSRVTVYGQSAGACSVSLHLLSPIVEPYLFQKAIVQSGSAYAEWGIENNPIEFASNLYKYLTNNTEEVGVEVMEAAFKDATLLDFMLASRRQIAMEPDRLNRIGRAVVQKAGTIRFLSDSPTHLISVGKYRTVPMFAGVTKHDGSFLLTGLYDSLEKFGLQDNDEFLRNNLTALVLNTVDIFDGSDSLIDIFNNNYFKKVFDEDKNLTFRDVAPGLTDIFGVLVLKAQTLKQAKINANYENNTYFYTMDYRGEYTRFGYGADTSKYPFKGGVHHSDDLLYLYPYPYVKPLNEADTKFAKLMTDLWTSFAITGKPSSSLLNVEWPKINRGKNGPFLHINEVSSIGKDFVDTEYPIATNENGITD